MERPPTSKQTVDLPPTPLTLDGSFILHQMFRVRWTAWRALGSEKKHVLTGAVATFGAMEENKQEPTGLFSLLGHKGDLMIVHFRKTLDEINHAELTVARTELNEYLEPTTSYLLRGRAGTVRSFGKTLRRPDGAGPSARHGGMEQSSRSGVGHTAPSGGGALVAGNSPAPLSVLLPDEQISRRDQELVQRADSRAAKNDARARHDRPPLRRAGDPDHFRIHRLR